MNQAIATRDAVEGACNRIFAQHQRVPTYDEVVRELKGGSNTTISKYLREWVQKRDQVSRASLPQCLETRGQTIVQELWAEATSAAATAFNRESAQLRHELLEAGAHNDELVAEIEELEKQGLQASQKISKLTIEISRRDAILQQQSLLESANARLLQERDDARVRAGRLEGQLTEVQRQLATLIATLPATFSRRPPQQNGRRSLPTRRATC